MGFLKWLLGGVDHGDELLYATLQNTMLDELKQAGWLKETRSEFKLLGSDNGFFEDIYKIFTGDMVGNFCLMMRKQALDMATRVR